VQADLPYIVIFAHSFSLVEKPGMNGGLARADRKARRVFEILLDDLAAAGIPTTTVSSLANTASVGMANRRDSLPQVDITVPAWRYAWHTVHARVAALKVVAPVFALAASIVLGAWFFARSVRKRRSAS
jgi:hypothetical protein